MITISLSYTTLWIVGVLVWIGCGFLSLFLLGPRMFDNLGPFWTLILFFSGPLGLLWLIPATMGSILGHR